MKRTASALLLLLASIACGSSEPSPATTPTAEAPAKPTDDDHHRMTPELEAFHALLSPLWHADKGDARKKDTCAAVSDFQAKAAAVKAAPAPASVEAASWSSAGAELEGAVSGLATACGGSDPAAFEPAFEAVHTRFHHAMELAAGEHDASGEQSGW